MAWRGGAVAEVSAVREHGALRGLLARLQSLDIWDHVPDGMDVKYEINRR